MWLVRHIYFGHDHTGQNCTGRTYTSHNYTNHDYTGWCAKRLAFRLCGTLVYAAHMSNMNVDTQVRAKACPHAHADVCTHVHARGYAPGRVCIPMPMHKQRCADSGLCLAGGAAGPALPLVVSSKRSSLAGTSLKELRPV